MPEKYFQVIEILKNKPSNKSVLTIIIGAVRRTVPTDSFKFAKLKLTTVDRCSLLNCTNEFLIGAVRQTARISMPILVHLCCLLFMSNDHFRGVGVDGI